MRINKFLASAGVASRRKSDELIRSGHVVVNGNVVLNLASDVNETDEVFVNGKKLDRQEGKIYIMLNKPKGVVSTVKDTHGRKTVVEMVTSGARLFPVGRLDEDSSGLILLTNDGDLAYQLTHPKFEVEKTYRLLIKGKVPSEKIEHLRSGVRLKDGMTAKARVKKIWETNEETVLEMKIHEGRKRQIRRMCETLKINLLELERIAIGDLSLGEMEYGKYRKLADDEVNRLRKMMSI